MQLSKDDDWHNLAMDFPMRKSISPFRIPIQNSSFLKSTFQGLDIVLKCFIIPHMCDLQFIFWPQCLRLSAANHISAAVNWAWEIFKHWKMRSKQRSLQLCPHLQSLHLMCVESNGYLISVSKSHHFFF